MRSTHLVALGASSVMYTFDHGRVRWSRCFGSVWAVRGDGEQQIEK